jgi:hypothetical protein
MKKKKTAPGCWRGENANQGDEFWKLQGHHVYAGKNIISFG